MSETIPSCSPKKTYLEAVLTPPTSPLITPTSSPYILSKGSIHKDDEGIIDSRLKWILNKKNEDSVCNMCKTGIEEYEWNSYYTIYVYRFTDEYNKYKIKIFNDQDNIINTNKVYCFRCREKITNEFKKNKLINEQKKDSLILMPPLVLE
jgi:hypothetical protein